MRGEVAEMAAKLKTINELTAKLIEENSPKDLLGPGETQEHREYVAGFARKIRVPHR